MNFINNGESVGKEGWKVEEGKGEGEMESVKM